jgi:hypothetical protein
MRLEQGGLKLTKQESASFLKKRSKKLLIMTPVPVIAPAR